MKIIIEGDSKEIAALVLELQGRISMKNITIMPSNERCSERFSHLVAKEIKESINHLTE